MAPGKKAANSVRSADLPQAATAVVATNQTINQTLSASTSSSGTSSSSSPSSALCLSQPLADAGEASANASPRSSISAASESATLQNDSSSTGNANWCWQNGKKSVYERLDFLFRREVLSDVTFILGRGNTEERIPAHK